jgi:hypothetical protein
MNAINWSNADGLFASLTAKRWGRFAASLNQRSALLDYRLWTHFCRPRLNAISVFIHSETRVWPRF